MRELSRPAVVEVLKELSTAVGADAGSALYLGDGDGVLHLAASAGHEPGHVPSIWQRLRTGRGAHEPQTLVLDLPADTPGVLVLGRRNRTDFTQQDLALARLYVRQLVDAAPQTPAGLRRNGWTQQLETIQRIAARLTRLASVDEVATAICAETRQVIGYDEAHVFVRADSTGA